MEWSYSTQQNLIFCKKNYVGPFQVIKNAFRVCGCVQPRHQNFSNGANVDKLKRFGGPDVQGREHPCPEWQMRGKTLKTKHKYEL